MDGYYATTNYKLNAYIFSDFFAFEEILDEDDCLHMMQN